MTPVQSLSLNKLWDLNPPLEKGEMLFTDKLLFWGEGKMINAGWNLNRRREGSQ